MDIGFQQNCSVLILKLCGVKVLNNVQIDRDLVLSNIRRAYLALYLVL